MGVASLVLGIVSLVFGLIGLGFPIGALCGIIGVILGALGRKNNPEKAGLATGGLVCSIIGTVISLLLFIACASCLGAAGALSTF